MKQGFRNTIWFLGSELNYCLLVKGEEEALWRRSSITARLYQAFCYYLESLRYIYSLKHGFKGLCSWISWPRSAKGNYWLTDDWLVDLWSVIQQSNSTCMVLISIIFLVIPFIGHLKIHFRVWIWKFFLVILEKCVKQDALTKPEMLSTNHHILW